MKSPARKAQEPYKILLVDDNHHGLIARRGVLEELGYEIATAQGGDEALELCAQTQFDLIVTDFKMPNMDGGEFIGRVRKSEPGARVILLSGFVEPLGLTEESTGADIVLSKSAGEVANLIRAIGRLLKVPRKPPACQGRAARASVTRA